MAYFVLATVKSFLFIDNTNQDTRINSMGAEADGFVNEQLQVFEAALPLGAPDAQIIALANQLTIALYYYYQNPDHPFQPVRDKKTEIKDYIKTHYRKQVENYEKAAWSKTSSGITGTEG